MTAAAFFDVDGTLTRSDIVRDHLRFRLSRPRTPAGSAWLLTAAPRALGALLLDHVSRRAVMRWVHAWYAGFAPADVAAWGRAFQRGEGMARTFPGALDLARRHASAGRRIVLVSGSVGELVRPYGELLERALDGPVRVESNELEVRDGRLTGRLVPPVLDGEAKARRVRDVAAEEGLDLAASHAHGDATSDIPMLEAVGHPVAVNPDRGLRRHARRRGWPVLDVRSRMAP